VSLVSKDLTPVYKATIGKGAGAEAHPYEAMEAFAKGVKIKWLSTVKQFGEDEILVEQMEMLPDGKGCVGTGQFQTLKTDSLVLAVGQHFDVEFLKKAPDIRIGRGNVVEVDAAVRASDGVFAGGDMIGGARTMTAAVGHGKKALVQTHPDAAKQMLERSQRGLLEALPGVRGSGDPRRQPLPPGVKGTRRV
jgi:thioredoxin reductase